MKSLKSLKNVFKLIIFILLSLVLTVTDAGIIILSNYDQVSETTIYQQGIAITLKNGAVKTIIDTNTNICIAVNHRSKRYLLTECHLFNSVINSIAHQQANRREQNVPLAVQELMTSNRPPRTPIRVKRSGVAAYQGFRVEKFQFIVDEELVAEYWVSRHLNDKIIKEVNIAKVNKILNVSKTNTRFEDGLDNVIDQKFLSLKKNNFALKEFRYTGSKTQKIYREISIRRVKIRKYLPPENYTMYATTKEYLNDSLKF